MSDFFADLERELRGAHRAERSPRGATIRRAVLAAAALTAVAAVLTFVARDSADPERSVPAGGTAGSDTVRQCFTDPPETVPAALLEEFAVLRRDGEQPLPPEISVTEQAGITYLYDQHARVVREKVVVQPALIRSEACEGRSEAGLCIGFYDREEMSELRCAALPDVVADGLEFRRPAAAETENVAVLVPDGVAEIAVGEPGEAALRTAVHDNVGILTLDDDSATAPLHEVRRGTAKAYETPPPGLSCAQIGKLDGPIPPEITDEFAIFSQPDMSDYAQGGAEYPDELAAIYFRGGTTFRTFDDEFAIGAGRIGDGAQPCEDLPLGICIGRLGGKEAACGTLAEIRRRGLPVRVDEGDSERLTVLVPDGVTLVRFRSGTGQSVEGNVASVRLKPGEQVASLERR